MNDEVNAMNRAFFFLLTCLAAQAATADLSVVRQDKLCWARSVDEIKKCESGSLMFFQPISWGNDQLPLVAVAAACDFRFPVAHNVSGVVCVFTPRRLHYLND